MIVKEQSAPSHMAKHCFIIVEFHTACDCSQESNKGIIFIRMRCLPAQMKITTTILTPLCPRDRHFRSVRIASMRLCTVGRMPMKSTRRVLGHWSVRSHRSLIRLLRTACAHSLARSLTHSLPNSRERDCL